MNRHSLSWASAACGLIALVANHIHAQDVITAPVRPSYVIDFSESQNKGVAAGNFNNFAFTVDLRNRARKVAAKRDLPQPDLVASYDYADCSKGQEAILERPLSALGPGQPAWIDYVDIELLPHSQRDVRWTGGVCYGARATNGKWRWNLVTAPLAYDPASDRVRARLWIKSGPITALKLVFDYSVPKQYAQKVTLIASPYSERAGK